MLKIIPLFICTLMLQSTHTSADELLNRIAAADNNKGQQLGNICQACHTVNKGGANKIGPNLYNVIGRNIATLNNYNYSSAMLKTEGQWDPATLDSYLTAPMQMVPGTTMAYPGISNGNDRAAVIAWLRLQSDNPIPLPTVVTQSDANKSSATEDPDLALLPKDKGREKVFYSCSVCHSIKLVVQQGLSRDSWKETLDWMVEDQAMQALDEESEKVILDYLSKHFGIDK